MDPGAGQGRSCAHGMRNKLCETRFLSKMSGQLSRASSGSNVACAVASEDSGRCSWSSVGKATGVAIGEENSS